MKDIIQDDDAQLAAMGHRPELKRRFSTWSMLGLAFAVLNVCPKSLFLPSTTLIMDLVVDGAVGKFVYQFGLRGEYQCGVGQYVHPLNSEYTDPNGTVSWPKWVPILSWITGWINVAGWVALVATNSLLSSQLIVGCISLMHQDYVAKRWHQFLIYIGLTVGAFVINAFGNAILPLLYRGAFTWSIGGFAIVSITVLACASPDFNSAYFVFCDFVNKTGWPDGVAWLLGLLQGGLGVTAFDAVAHMIEEVPGAATEGPKIMVACVAIGTFTGSIFLICLLFVAGPMNQVTTAAAGPLLQILYDATQNRAGAICLLMLPLVCMIYAILSVMTTSSRMIFAFARDGGLPASRFFATVHPTLKLPLNALMLSVVVVICFGCIFMGSSSAFNAIISASVVALDLSYGIPIAINCLQGRKALPPGKWKLPNAVGWVVDIVALSYISLTTVLFVFPPDRKLTGSNMNYCIAAFAVIIMISVFQWVVDGRKNFTGPRVDLAIEALDTLPAESKVEPTTETETDEKK
ncbi:hypothetical protein N7474_002513 [Penicillium riverlandense]|uniref:uncharacterized protein n=1 Tax=Penicillium riverlandense TaxID=1903569 RepID=UPI00254660BB|nr:uncharacterized protein N7474_002513 [Penicillium riverlandense]KAJ5825375.1 hypothetical protein N7474_002513 [Penicillium riverlandense]